MDTDFGEGNFVATASPVFQIICVVSSRGYPLGPVFRHQLVLNAAVVRGVGAGEPGERDGVIGGQVGA